MDVKRGINQQKLSTSHSYTDGISKKFIPNLSINEEV